MSVAANVEQPIGRIVVGIDGSPPSEHALRWAADQARLTEQELDAVIAWHAPIPYDTPLKGEIDWGRAAAGMLEKTITRSLVESDARRVVQHVIHGHPAKVLIDAASDAGLLVVGSRGHGAFTGMLLGSVSQHVIAHASCPVVVVHEHRTATGRIVVGVDGSPESERALRWAAQQARLTGRELHAVIAWHVPVTYGLTAGSEHDWAADSDHALDVAVTRALGEQDAARVVQDVVEDSPAGALLSAAEKADLLVVGCRGRAGFTGMLLGSVSRQVASHAACPVVVHHGTSASRPAR